MNHSNNDNNQDTKVLHDLMQKANHELPPTELDNIILQQAKNAGTNKSEKTNWKPWMAAASVVLVLPMIWLLSQNQELAQINSPMIPEASSSDAAPAEGAPQAEPVYDTQLIDMEAVPAPAAKKMQNQAMQKPPALKPMTENLQEMIEEQGKLSVTGSPTNRSAIEANRDLLMDELKAGKRTIKPSTMGPLMALEYEQFNRYLEKGQFDLADQLLTEMQDSYPEFDFEEMIYQLALAEANQTENP